MNTDTIPVQTGPVYHCFTCGAEPVTFLAYFRPCGSALDAWSLYIWYLKLPCGCKNTSRVVRLGDCIAPLSTSGSDGLTPADVPTIRAALQAIAQTVPLEHRRLDPVTRIVYGLLAGSITPYDAIVEMRTLHHASDSDAIRPVPIGRTAPINLPSESDAIQFLPEGVHS